MHGPRVRSSASSPASAATARTRAWRTSPARSSSRRRLLSRPGIIPRLRGSSGRRRRCRRAAARPSAAPLDPSSRRIRGPNCSNPLPRRRPRWRGSRRSSPSGDRPGSAPPPVPTQGHKLVDQGGADPAAAPFLVHPEILDRRVAPGHVQRPLPAGAEHADDRLPGLGDEDRADPRVRQRRPDLGLGLRARRPPAAELEQQLLDRERDRGDIAVARPAGPPPAPSPPPRS